MTVTGAEPLPFPFFVVLLQRQSRKTKISRPEVAQHRRTNG